ncbi:MAG TPA: EAL domain-containing protein [Devosiaceae bacterium]|nr:EAL domain-containing protein [Devosiaceae bacterium]
MAVAQGSLTSSLSDETIRNLDKVLRTARAYFGMDVAFVNEFLGPGRVFRSVDGLSAGPVRQGGVIPLATAYCRRVVEGQLPELVSNTMESPARVFSETHEIPIGAHMCVPIRLASGQSFGTFCCFSYLTNPTLGERELQVMRAFAEILAREIDRDVRTVREGQRRLRRLSQAIEAGDPQIIFQPICRLSDGRITGVEALSRFSTDPATPPDVWFVEAEAAGIGTEFELLAIRKAVAAAAELPTDLTLSLNASPTTLLDPKLAEALEPLAGERIVIEITERRPVGDYDVFRSAIAPLRSRGVRIAIDDAGAGYSSLRHVLEVKPDVIKLDISLTHEIDRDPTRYALGAGLMAFARLTGTGIVAEGIEGAGELSTLRRLGIERGQGYYLSRPLTMPTFLELLERSRGQMGNLAPIAALSA